ncbi:MAG: hypothetical protein K2Q20_04140 [Phycisphaerales bacterium]|nr:hypothetical protein [Phycisphaerales bacterium]
MSKPSAPKDHKPNDFASQAQGENSGIVREFVDLIRHNKKWWLAPVIIALLVLGVLVVLGSTAAAPFIYTLF